MDLIEAAVWVLGHSEGANAVKDAASRYLIEAFDSGWPGPRPKPAPTEQRLAFHVGKPDPLEPELQPHEHDEGYVRPGEPAQPATKPEPELWAVIALSDGTWGLWHPREQSVLSSPREGLPYTAAIARRDSLNKELLETVYKSKPVLAHANSPPPPAKPQPTHASGLVHHYAEEAEAQRLAQESQEQYRPKPRK